MITALPTVTVSTIYVAWQAVQRRRQLRDRLLRERVAFMLWAAAHSGDDDDEPPDNEEPRPCFAGPHASTKRR